MVRSVSLAIMSVGYSAEAQEPDRWKVLLYLLCLLPVYVLGILFWRQQVDDPITLTAFLIDRLLQLGVVVAFGAAFVVVFRPERQGILAGFVIAFVGFGLSASVLGASFRPPRDIWIVLLALVTLFVSLMVGLRFWRLIPNDLRIQHPGAVLVGALAASALPALQLWNSTVFAAASQKVSLSLAPQVMFQEQPPDSQQNRVRVAVTVTNPSSVRALVIISDIDVCWWEADATPEYDTDKLMHVSNCASWAPIARGSWIDAGAALENSMTLTMPADSPRVVVIARAAYARADRLVLVKDSENEMDRLGTCRDVTTWTIREEAKFRALAQQEKYLVFGDADSDGGTNYYFTSKDEFTCPDSLELDDYYGVTQAKVNWEDWMVPPAEPGERAVDMPAATSASTISR